MMKHKLPENWIVLNSKSHPHRVYYFNVKTNQSSWIEPIGDQTEQETIGCSKKRKISVQKDEINQVQSTVPEHSVSETKMPKRKKLIAKHSIEQTQKKTNEGKDTPQMKAIREKMFKRMEKNSIKAQNSKSTKNMAKSSSQKLDKCSSWEQKSDTHSNLELTPPTPQMQILLEKIKEKTPKYKSKMKKAEEDKSIIYRQEKPIKTRSRNQNVDEQKTISEVSLENKNQKEEQDDPNIATIAKKLQNKKKNKKSKLNRQRKKLLKINLGNERMEKLRESLTPKYNDSVNDNSSPLASSSPLDKFVGEKLPNIHKNVEVRLVRLKERFINDKISINKNSCKDKGEETVNLSEKSVTTVDDLIKQSNENSLYEEMDWEPLEDEKITFEVQAVRTQLCTGNNLHTSSNISCNTSKYASLMEQPTRKYLYIVVDTNVFLSNINAIDLARETTFKSYDHSIIVIPWTVIRELDYIKDHNGKSRSTTLCVKARKAINYINKLFSSRHPYIIGQTSEDVEKNKVKFSVDCPDDEILQTCLQIRDLRKSVVLLSYDMNLCNKAMIYDIVTLGRNDPLEKIDYLNATTFINESLSNCNNDTTSILSQELYLSDEIYEDIKSVIRDFLTVIVSKEMYTLYGEFWEKYVVVRPPWTTVTVLKCAIKHWIAAISESFRRKAEVIMKELLEIFENTTGKKSLKEDSYILNKCSDLVQMVNIDKHSDLMLRISKKIDELKEKCQDYESRINNQKLCDAIGIENNIEEQECRAQKAFQYFEMAYVFARDMCGMAAEVIGMPCSFQYNIPNPLPSIDYVKQIQPELAANVNKLLCSLSTVTEQVKNSCIDYRSLTNLHQTLITFLPESAPTAMKLIDVDLVPLDIYCCIKRKEDILTRGLRQLQELSTHFCRLASYKCT